MTTAIYVGYFVGFWLVTYLSWAAFLRLGLYWARAENVSKRRLAVGALLICGLQLALLPVLRLPSIPAPSAVSYLARLAAGALVACVIVARLFRLSWGRGVRAWLPTLIPGLGMALFVSWVMLPHLLDAFKPPTNSMAPTILGPHRVGACPVCGRPAFGAPLEEVFGEPLLICEAFHVSAVPEGNDLAGGDHFLVLKTIEPRRWDLIVFRYPGEPEVIFVKRLVGLPGETVTIEDGAVWIDGVRLTPPAELTGLRYENDLSGPTLWGHPSLPARLGKDEYFVLGDFSLRSKDSRLWQDAAPGHRPYAVPLDYVEGVVTHIYWPPGRARVVRLPRHQ